jgi:hypothetical protein
MITGNNYETNGDKLEMIQEKSFKNMIKSQYNTYYSASQMRYTVTLAHFTAQKIQNVCKLSLDRMSWLQIKLICHALYCAQALQAVDQLGFYKHQVVLTPWNWLIFISFNRRHLQNLWTMECITGLGNCTSNNDGSLPTDIKITPW